ncbi:MAG: IclR family transcriptional regulator [Tissierellia bacterium]|jgi:DNA-binding IclR family transcriptional regulator|nr:IclR family transcriptional regulator [Tissierellia bacterium]
MELVQSVDRTLTILEVLSDYSDGLGITEISDLVSLHKSTVHRLLSTLIYKGYVVREEETSKYKITFKLFELGSKKVHKLDLLKISRPYTKMLMESVNEVVHLIIREDTDIVYIDKVEANNTISMASRIGKRNPMYCTATGKAILAFLPEDEVLKVWNNSKIIKLTKNTNTDFILFKKELQTIKEKCYAIDDEENEIGVKCVGAPIFDMNGNVVAAISVTGPVTRITDDKIGFISKEVIQCTNLISKEMGYKLI